MNKIYIIILHFGDSNSTRECIESILKHEREIEGIIVVDNDPENKFSMKSQFSKKKIKILRNEKNLGYAGGMNKGIEYALAKKADYVLLLNNDVIFEKNIIEPLLRFVDDKKQIGIVGPAIKFYRQEEAVYDLGGKVNKVFGKTSHHEVKRIIENKEKMVDYISGCCMLVKREVFEKIGMFDEKFFLYYEDVDFCLRAEKAGYLTYVLSSIFVYHKLSKSVGKVSSLAIYNQTKSALIFGRKHVSFSFLNFLFVFYQSLIFFLKNPGSGIAAFNALIKLLSSKARE